MFAPTGLLLILVSLAEKLSAEDSSGTDDHPEFFKSSVFHPVLSSTRSKRSIESTLAENGHIDALEVTVPTDGRTFVLDLRLNSELIGGGYKEIFQEDGETVIRGPVNVKAQHCHYQGHVRGKPGSWAAISTCDGISGVISDGGAVHYIEKVRKQNASDNAHFLLAQDDLKPTEFRCGFDDTPTEHAIHRPRHSHSSSSMHHTLHPRVRRSLPSSDADAPNDINAIDFGRGSSHKDDKSKKKTNVRRPWNADDKSRYVELLLVVDKTIYEEHGKDKDKIYNRAKTIANIVNSLYAPLNIFVGLVGVVIWTEHDEITLKPNGDETLTNFLHYRRKRLVKMHPNDNAQLLTGTKFEGGVVGKALKGPICTYEFSGGVNMDHSEVVGLVATTVAHEMGHNFGMEHDKEACECPEARCIMAPSSSPTRPSHWSSCSKEYLSLAFDHGMDYCLRNLPDTLFGPVCGNGFLEEGEECDCGLQDRCEDNPCCDATTCKLAVNATCATGECCDLKTCHPKRAATECRAAVHECDLPEFCTGESEFCPEDVKMQDGVGCSNGNAYCFDGSCRTHHDQCRLLWGPSGNSSDEKCYEMNTRGTRHGNCGYYRENKTFVSCANEHVMCGMVHCSHKNERLEFGMESVAILSHKFLPVDNGKSIKEEAIPCRTAIVDLGLNEIDPGLAPDGAKCGVDKLCVNQKCTPVASLKVPKCPYNCNGKGFCNSKGHCHCKVGYAPPYCDDIGPGGSVDSGPASDPSDSSAFVVAMYVFFLLIVPLVAVLSCLVYYGRRENIFLWCKRQRNSVAQRSRTPQAQSAKSRRFPIDPSSCAAAATAAFRNAKLPASFNFLRHAGASRVPTRNGNGAVPTSSPTSSPTSPVHVTVNVDSPSSKERLSMMRSSGSPAASSVSSDSFSSSNGSLAQNPEGCDVPLDGLIGKFEGFSISKPSRTVSATPVSKAAPGPPRSSVSAGSILKPARKAPPVPKPPSSATLAAKTAPPPPPPPPNMSPKTAAGKKNVKWASPGSSEKPLISGPILTTMSTDLSALVRQIPPPPPSVPPPDDSDEESPTAKPAVKPAPSPVPNAAVPTSPRLKPDRPASFAARFFDRDRSESPSEKRHSGLSGRLSSLLNGSSPQPNAASVTRTQSHRHVGKDLGRLFASFRSGGGVPANADVESAPSSGDVEAPTTPPEGKKSANKFSTLPKNNRFKNHPALKAGLGEERRNLRSLEISNPIPQKVDVNLKTIPIKSRLDSVAEADKPRHSWTPDCSSNNASSGPSSITSVQSGRRSESMRTPEPASKSKLDGSRRPTSSAAAIGRPHSVATSHTPPPPVNRPSSPPPPRPDSKASSRASSDERAFSTTTEDSGPLSLIAEEVESPVGTAPATVSYVAPVHSSSATRPLIGNSNPKSGSAESLGKGLLDNDGDDVSSDGSSGGLLSEILSELKTRGTSVGATVEDETWKDVKKKTPPSPRKPEVAVKPKFTVATQPQPSKPAPPPPVVATPRVTLAKTTVEVPATSSPSSWASALKTPAPFSTATARGPLSSLLDAKKKEDGVKPSSEKVSGYVPQSISKPLIPTIHTALSGANVPIAIGARSGSPTTVAGKPSLTTKMTAADRPTSLITPKATFSTFRPAAPAVTSPSKIPISNTHNVGSMLTAASKDRLNFSSMSSIASNSSNASSSASTATSGSGAKPAILGSKPTSIPNKRGTTASPVPSSARLRAQSPHATATIHRKASQPLAKMAAVAAATAPNPPSKIPMRSPTKERPTFTGK